MKRLGPLAVLLQKVVDDSEISEYIGYVDDYLRDIWQDNATEEWLLILKAHESVHEKGDSDNDRLVRFVNYFLILQSMVDSVRRKEKEETTV